MCYALRKLNIIRSNKIRLDSKLHTLVSKPSKIVAILKKLKKTRARDLERNNEIVFLIEFRIEITVPA